MRGKQLIASTYGPLQSPHSAPNIDPNQVLASSEEPPKSDRSHYPKYKPLVFPAAQHDISSPQYTGPLIQTPRIKPCEALSPGMPESMVEPSAPFTDISKPLSKVQETINGQSDSCLNGRSSKHSDHDLDQQQTQNHICQALSGTMSGSDPGEGSECEITVALNTASGHDELTVEENDSAVCSDDRRQHLFVPLNTAAVVSLKQSEVSMEERLLTERRSEEPSVGLQRDQTKAVEPIGRLVIGAAHSDTPVIDLAPEEGVQSLQASEMPQRPHQAGQCSQFSSRLSSATGVLTLSKGLPQSNRPKVACSSDDSSGHTARPAHARMPHVDKDNAVSAAAQCSQLRLSCEYRHDPSEERSELHDCFPDGPACSTLGPPQGDEPQTIFMHDNPLCWPESPSKSADSAPQDMPVQPQHCSSPSVHAPIANTSGAIWRTQHVHAEKTATKETQTSSSFTAAALRAALGSSNDATAASSSASFSILDPASNGHHATIPQNESGAPTEDVLAVLSPVHESDEANCALPARPARPGRTPPRRFLSAARPPPHATPPCDIGSGAKLAADSSSIAIDTSVCLSETGTIFESCCEPSSLHSSIDFTTADCEPGRDSCCVGVASADLQGGDSVKADRCCFGVASADLQGGDSFKADSGCAPGRSESSEMAGSGAVGYLACPPHDDAKDRVLLSVCESSENDREDATGVFERMRAVVTSRLNKISPRLTNTAAKSDRHATDSKTSASEVRVQETERAVHVSSEAQNQLKRPCCAMSAPCSQSGPGDKAPMQSPRSLAVPSHVQRAGSLGTGTLAGAEQQPGSKVRCLPSVPSHDLPMLCPASGDAQEGSSACLSPSNCVPKLQLSSAAQRSEATLIPTAEESSMMPSSSMTASESFETACLCAESGTVTADNTGSGNREQKPRFRQGILVGPHTCTEDTEPQDAASMLPPVHTVDVDTELESNDLPGEDTQDASEALSIDLGGSQSLTASFPLDSAASTCSAPSFKFAVHDRSTHVTSPDTDSSSSSLHPQTSTRDARSSSAPAFQFPPCASADVGMSEGDSDRGIVQFSSCPGHLQSSSATGHGSVGRCLPPGACPAAENGSACVQPSMRLKGTQPFMGSYAALSPPAPRAMPLRLETVDEHTPSPMHPLHKTALQMPPGHAGKARPGVAAMMHMHPRMHGDLSPDITWSPLRQRGMQLPSPNYSSPAALGAMHGHAMLGHSMHAPGHTLPPEQRGGAGGEVPSHPVSPLLPAASSVAGIQASWGSGGTNVTGERRRGGSGRRPWLWLTSPRAKAAAGEGSGLGAASEAVAEAGARWQDREHGAGPSFWRQQHQGAGAARAMIMNGLPEDGRRDVSQQFTGNAPHALFQGPIDVSASVAATTVTLSDALLPMPPGDTATESLEIGMPHAAGTPMYAQGAAGPGSHRSGDVLDTTGPSHSSGVARLLPHHSSTTPSEVPSTGEPWPVDVPAPAPAAMHLPAESRMEPYRSVEAPASSGSTHSDTGRGEQELVSRSGRLLQEADEHLQAGSDGEVAGIQSAVQAAAGAEREGNVVDGAMSTTTPARQGSGVHTGSHMGKHDAKPGTGAAAPHVRRSWLGMCVCCGKKGMADL